MSAEGWELAREGEQRAYDAALATWKEEARASLYKVACLYEEFTTDEVWADLAARGIPEPRENRAIAGVMAHGKKEEWCRPSVPKRRRESNRPVHHSFPCMIWVSLIAGAAVPVLEDHPLPSVGEQMDLLAEVQRMAGL